MFLVILTKIDIAEDYFKLRQKYVSIRLKISHFNLNGGKLHPIT